MTYSRLQDRYDNLIEANKNNRYVYCDVKKHKYKRIMLELIERINNIKKANRLQNKEISEFLQKTKGLNGSQILQKYG